MRGVTPPNRSRKLSRLSCASCGAFVCITRNRAVGKIRAPLSERGRASSLAHARRYGPAPRRRRSVFEASTGTIFIIVPRTALALPMRPVRCRCERSGKHAYRRCVRARASSAATMSLQGGARARAGARAQHHHAETAGRRLRIEMSIRASGKRCAAALAAFIVPESCDEIDDAQNVSSGFDSGAKRVFEHLPRSVATSSAGAFSVAVCSKTPRATVRDSLGNCGRRRRRRAERR